MALPSLKHKEWVAVNAVNHTGNTASSFLCVEYQCKKQILWLIILINTSCHTLNLSSFPNPIHTKYTANKLNHQVS